MEMPLGKIDNPCRTARRYQRRQAEKGHAASPADAPIFAGRHRVALSIEEERGDELRLNGGR